MSKLTGTASEVGAYEFTTLTTVPGIIQYKGAKLQVNIIVFISMVGCILIFNVSRFLIFLVLLKVQRMVRVEVVKSLPVSFFFAYVLQREREREKIDR